MRGKYLLINYILFCIGLTIVFQSCSKQAEPVNFVNITDHFEIQLHQELSADGGVPLLNISSVELQDCKNSYISHQTIFSADKLQLILNDILTEGECEIGSALVSEEVLIDNPNSALSIEINLKGVIKNSGILYTSPLDFDLKFDEFDGLKITRTKLNKILPKMIWGSYSLSNNEVAQQIDAYLKTLDINETIRKGDFGHFYVSQENSIVIYGEEEKEENKTFLITNKKDIGIIELKLQDFKQLDPSLVFHATNYDGNSLNIE